MLKSFTGISAERVILLLLCVLSFIILRREWFAVRVAVFGYHHIDPNSSVNTDLSITPRKFQEDMIALKKAGYTTIFFRDLIDFCAGKKNLPAKPALVTFDDGYESNYTYAYPLLRQLGMKATVFIIGRSVGRKTDALSGQPILPHFSYEQAWEMVASGVMDIQLHTVNLHTPNVNMLRVREQFPTARAYENYLRADVLTLQNEIKARLGVQAVALAYPYGLHDAVTENILRRAGVKVTVTTEKGGNFLGRNAIGLYGLKRNFTGGASMENFLRKYLLRPLAVNEHHQEHH
jgi:peptidoglycan/xylan/chitin deacetylase (PgdA/CDA1 family)